MIGRHYIVGEKAPQWEYLIGNMPQRSREENKDECPYDAAIAYLNNLGLQGWELVSAKLGECVFKRPIQ